MTGGTVIAKELRVLAGPWAACLAALVTARLLEGYGRFFEIWIPAYVLGATSLGAWSIGHEYVYRTLPCVLAQPMSRKRLLFAKLAVLAAAELTLWAAVTALGFRNGPRVTESETLAFGLVPVLGGISVAPWLTILYRNVIAGSVFTVAVPGLLLIGSQVLYFEFYRQALPSGYELKVLFWGSLLFCAVGAVMSWRAFMNLEAPDGGSSELSWLDRFRRPPASSTTIASLTRGHPIWMLVKKELRLQSVPIAVAGLYGFGWLTFVLYWKADPRGGDVLGALTFVDGVLVSMLIGSLASAEERQLGTLEWQVLLPVATSKQWAVKVSTALVLAVVLAIVWPGALLSINPGLWSIGLSYPFLIAGVVLFTSVSLYASSLSGDGLRAMLISVPAVVGAFVVAVKIAESIRLRSAPIWSQRTWQRSGLANLADPGWLLPALELAIVAAVITVILRFAAANHRSAERHISPAQIVLLAVSMVAGSIALAAVVALA
jgi:hypothetical protein